MLALALSLARANVTSGAANSGGLQGCAQLHHVLSGGVLPLRSAQSVYFFIFLQASARNRYRLSTEK
jgi:hypothetical protein